MQEVQGVVPCVELGRTWQPRPLLHYRWKRLVGRLGGAGLGRLVAVPDDGKTRQKMGLPGFLRCEPLLELPNLSPIRDTRLMPIPNVISQSLLEKTFNKTRYIHLML